MSTLDENVLNERQEAYLAWLCLPPAERVPPTKKAYSRETPVDYKTMLRWEKLDVFRTAWAKAVDDIVGSPERQQRLLDRLYDAGIAGDVKSADLYFRVTGKMAPAQLTVSTSKAAVSELSDDDLRSLVASAAANEQSRRLKVVG